MNHQLTHFRALQLNIAKYQQPIGGQLITHVIQQPLGLKAKHIHKALLYS